LFEVQLGPDGRIKRTALDLPEGNLSQTKKRVECTNGSHKRSSVRR
jgi:hypothetical protein